MPIIFVTEALIAVQACPRLYCEGFPNLTLLLLQVRAGEGQSEADGYVFTNPVYKTSMYSGLTPKARQQVASETVPRLRALGACTEVYSFSHPQIARIMPLSTILKGSQNKCYLFFRGL